jgi:hypothetical protein
MEPRSIGGDVEDKPGRNMIKESKGTENFKKGVKRDRGFKVFSRKTSTTSIFVGIY